MRVCYTLKSQCTMIAKQHQSGKPKIKNRAILYLIFLYFLFSFCCSLTIERRIIFSCKSCFVSLTTLSVIRDSISSGLYKRIVSLVVTMCISSCTLIFFWMCYLIKAKIKFCIIRSICFVRGFFCNFTISNYFVISPNSIFF